MKRYRTITLGCKVNQCESAAIGHLLNNAGYAKAQSHDAPDVVVINTCTVTGKAAMQSRQEIRKAVRAYPQARIVVAGCHAQVAAEKVRAMQGVHLVVGHQDKMDIAALLAPDAAIASKAIPAAPVIDKRRPFARLPSVAHEARTRAFLKIQDGCNTRCTYCIVPHARGPSRSMAVADVFTHMRRLKSQGFQEVVLTGIHLGAYGADLVPPTHLTAMLDHLTDPPAVDRIRISSVEPSEVTRSMVDLFVRRQPCLCRHFHVPLQSGDNTILRRMGRPYTRSQFARVINHIHQRIPMAAIGVDVMAGFPGETDDAFLHTCRLIEALPITYLHVFPFSPREGTPAARMNPKVPEALTKERCRHLRRLGEAKRNAFLHSMIGRRLPVLIQSPGDGRHNGTHGLSDNYLPVHVADGKLAENTIVSVDIACVSPQGLLIGTVAGTADGSTVRG